MTPSSTRPLPHVPVFRDRVVELLAAAPPGPLVDATVGAGGHAAALLAARAQRDAHAWIVGIDRDPSALSLARERLGAVPGDVRVELARARFDDLAEVLDDRGIDTVAGVLFDLGVSSMHLDRAERGFSYRREGPLDMRMDPGSRVSAADLVNDADEAELTRILRRFGEEPMAPRIARAIIASRPLTTTTQLAEVVRDAIPAARRRHGGHPATRTFQALRIAVNDELDALATALPTALDRLMPGGRCVVLSYHSLEDRIVKRAFADAARGCTCPPGLPVCACGRVPLVEHLVRRPERPGPDEVAANPRASAALLRAVRRTSEHP